MQTRSKAGAFLLAFFMSFWTWCYTYKNDGWKFWIGLVISVTCWWMLFIPNIAIWIWAMIDSTMTDKKDEYSWNEYYWK